MAIDPDAYGGRLGMQALDRLCRERASAGDLPGLRNLLLTRADATFEKHEVPRIVAAALASVGIEGIRELANLIKRAPGSIYPAAILDTLWRVSIGDRSIPSSSLGIEYPETHIPDLVRRAAQIVVDDLIVEAQTDADLLGTVMSVQQSSSWRQRASEPPSTSPSQFNLRVMQVIRDGSILLTERLLEDFEAVIAERADEHIYQTFLENHPVILDPLAAEVLNRQRLGVELITDFVIRRHDDRYVVVEIERPQDQVFTKAGDFTARFTHAVGQVMDFQGWIAANVAYAQTHLPLVESPAGLLIMGTRSSMTSDQQAKLRRWCANSRHVEVITFDDLAIRARSLHRSLRRLT